MSFNTLVILVYEMYMWVYDRDTVGYINFVHIINIAICSWCIMVLISHNNFSFRQQELLYIVAWLMGFRSIALEQSSHL